jgi:hypothetical protein
MPVAYPGDRRARLYRGVWIPPPVLVHRPPKASANPTAASLFWQLRSGRLAPITTPTATSIGGATAPGVPGGVPPKNHGAWDATAAHHTTLPAPFQPDRPEPGVMALR